jgi:hypothetical protein
MSCQFLAISPIVHWNDRPAELELNAGEPSQFITFMLSQLPCSIRQLATVLSNSVLVLTE